MNVEYRCPKCGGCKHFGLPGGTIMKCRHCADQPLLQQVEESTAPDFLNIDEDGRTKSKDIIVAGNERRRAEPIMVTDVRPDPVIQMELQDAREAYLEVFGELPDMRYGASRLTELVLAQRRLNESVQEVTGEVEDTTESDSEDPEDPEEMSPVVGEIVSEIPDADESDNDNGSSE